MSERAPGNNNSSNDSNGRKIPKVEDCPARNQQPGGCPHTTSSSTGADDDKDAGGGLGSNFLGRRSLSSWWNTPTNKNTAASVTSTNEEHASCPAAAAGTGLVAAASSVEEAARHAQTPQPDQTVELDRERQVSSIPRRSVDSVPHHQYNNNETTEESAPNNKWVYPSEQQLYNAMRKKGWSNVPEESIPTVLQIHNHINEHTWRQIRAWEGLSNDNTNNNNNNDLILTRFQGRPRDLTPKAFFWSRILGRNAPFDRHDWYVQRPSSPENANETLVEQRYVIDYYYLPAARADLPPIPYIDARPAITDHPLRALYLHGRWWGQWAFPGIATYLQQQGQQQRAAPQLNRPSSLQPKQPRHESK